MITSPYYQQQIDAALQTPVRRRGEYTQQFALFSANLYQCLPGIPTQNHELLFAHACAHQALAIAEQGCPQQALRLAAENPFPKLLNAPGIIATFHLGSYRLIGRWLALHDIPFTLVLSADVYQQQGPIYSRIIQDSASTDFRFGLLDAEHPLALMHMKRALDEGHHLVVYLDGNTGAGGSKTIGRHGCIVPFLHGNLYVRTGVATLAAMMRCPIYPILNWRDVAGNSHFRDAEAIWITGDRTTRGNDVQNVLEQLYAWLAVVVKTFPAQWEGWFYAHHMLVHHANLLSDGRGLDGPDWITFGHREHVYQLNRRSYRCVQVKPANILL